MRVRTGAGVIARVPCDSFGDDIPLVAVVRGGFVGSLHRGSFVVVDSNGIPVLAGGNPSERVFLRSAAKPFQVMPAVLAGALDRFGITEIELAVLCASHNGEPRHIDAVVSVLDKLGLSERALRCGTHPPIYEPAARDRWRLGVDPSPACNNCSGAHAGMLLACRSMGWEMRGYGDPDHPLQVSTREILALYAGVERDQVEIAIDNCAVPTFRLPLQAAARAFARLASGNSLPPEQKSASARVVSAMTANPGMVAGLQRFDTDVMAVTHGEFVAKGGAEGFQGIGSIRAGVGIAIKISDGSSRAIPPTAMRLLNALRLLSDSELEQLAQHIRPEVRNLQNQVVGYIEPTFSVEGTK